MGERMRAYDWSATSLGPAETWAQSLKTAVRILLTSRFAMWMAWGPELIFFCNDAYLPTVGVKRDWVLGARSDRVWAEIWPDIGPRIEHVLLTGEATWDEQLLLYLERSGFPEETYHTFSYSPLSDDSGVTVGMLCVVAEVTERVIVERQLAMLRDLGSRFAVVLTPDEVMRSFEACLASESRDLPVALIYAHDAASQRATLIAAHGLEHNHPDAPEEFDYGNGDSVWPFLDIAMGGSIEVTDLTGRFAGLSSLVARPERVLILPIAGSESSVPQGFLVAGLNPHRALDAEYRGFVQILTSQVAAATARADEYMQANARADWLAEIDEAKTAFFSNVSHEFRTPLTLMLGPLEDVLADAASLPPAQAERITVAHRNGLRLLRLVNALLDFSRLEAGRVQASYRPTDLSAITAELASTFRSACEGAGLALNLVCDTLPAPVYVDPDMWEKIVLNLLSNAFKFTFEGAITVRVSAADDAAILEVIDTGVGIPPAELPRLFERFHRVEGARGRSFEGSGIGLALVLELVRLHGGTISVDSVEGRGTAFTVRIPLGTAHLRRDQLAAAPAASIDPSRARAFADEAMRWVPATIDTDIVRSDVDEKALVSAKRRDGRVLLVDDNADLREYVQGLLSAVGYQVEIAGDGEAALEMIRAARPDLVLTDVMMPRMNGFELLAAIRADPELGDLPVIMLSARAGEEAQGEGLEAGADDYLSKAFSARELLARVSANLTMTRVRRQAMEAMRVSEAFLASVLAKAPVGMLVADVNGRVLNVNERGMDLLGLDEPAGEFHNLIGEKAIHVDGRPYTTDEYPTNRALAGERLDGLRVIYLKEGPDPNRRIVLQVDAAPIRDADGGIIGAVTVFEDASIRDRTERELQRRVALRTRERDRAWNNAQDLLLVIDAQGMFHAANPAWTVLLGWHPDEVIGRHFLDFIPEEDHETAEMALAAAVHEPIPHFENRYLHKDGSYRLISWNATPDQGLVYATGRDITDEDKAAKALHAAEARLRSVFETTYQFLGFLTPEGVMLDSNSASLAAIGKTVWDVVGQFIWETPWFSATPGMAELVKEGVAKAASGQTVRHEVTLNLQGEDRVFDFSLRPVVDQAGSVLGIVPQAMELTEQRRAEEALHQSQKMEAVGQLTGGIAHDFNNMLAIVMGSLELLSRRLGPDDVRSVRYVGAAMDGARRAATLTQRLLAFSRQQPLKPEPLDANKLVAGMSDLLHHSIGADIRLETVLAGGLWRVHADPSQLENVIVNLAVNARDAMPDGGRLTIETQNAHLDDRYVASHPGVAVGQYVMIAVTDTGQGMPPEVAAKAFDPFFTTKAVGKGTGLGLSQVYGFVKQSGGHVKIYTERGQGTTVKAYLPRFTAPDGEQTDREPVTAILLGDGQEVMLVVEDEAGVRRFTVEMLEELGYRVLEADGAASALRMIGAHPEISLLFTDIIMPDVNGRQLATEVRRQRPDLKILFTTGYTRNAVVHNGVLDKGVELISKPFTIEELAAKVRYILDTPDVAAF